MALDFAHSLVRRSQFAHQGGIVSSFGGKAVEVLQRSLNQNPSRWCRSREVADGIVDIKEKRVGELSDIVEALLGASAFSAGDAGLAEGHAQGRQQGNCPQWGCTRADLVSMVDFGCRLSGGFFRGGNGR